MTDVYDKIVAELVPMARAEGERACGDRYGWERVTLRFDELGRRLKWDVEDMVMVMTTTRMQVVGRMPLGWGMETKAGSETFAVTRVKT